MAEGDRFVLGLNTWDHDVSAVLLRNGRIEVAIAKERLTRRKHDLGFCGRVVDYCLEAAGIDLAQVELVVRNCYVLPPRDLERRLLQADLPQHLSAPERPLAEVSPLFLPVEEKYRTISHHLAHAWSAFAASPFDEGVVMVVDGVGSYRADVTEPLPAGDDAHPLAREAESWYRFSGTTLTPLRKVWLPPTRGVLADEFHTMDGVGALYSRVSRYVFGHWNRCGEVMGLAPYGRATGDRLMWLENDELVVAPWDERRHRPFLGGADDAAWEAHPAREEWADLSWRVQEDTERILIQRARRLHELTGARNLCLAGGVALNCVANGKILRHTPFERVFIQPAAGDDGTALGCALHGWCEVLGQPRGEVMERADLGRTYDTPWIEEALRPWSVRLSTRVQRPADLAASVADLLARGRVVGWCRGRSEFGPRALGSRSILADPRDGAMRDHVNRNVKHRQAFRPFAPVVRAERARDYFELERESPFMLLAARVRPEMRDRIPAVVHVDGTARVQTLRREHNPMLYRVLEEFEERTGEAVLLNTSFNLRGEAIVETPIDAVETFLRSRLDALVLEDRLVTKRPAHGTLFPFLELVEGARDGRRVEELSRQFRADLDEMRRRRREPLR